jgi:hypothetical protein
MSSPLPFQFARGDYGIVAITGERAFGGSEMQVYRHSWIGVGSGTRNQPTVRKKKGAWNNPRAQENPTIRT